LTDNVANSRPTDVLLSIVAPAYNEEGNVGPLIERIDAVCSPLNIKFEAIIVDDCSTDATPQRLRELQVRFPWLRVIRLEKNSGQTAAMDAGFRAAYGQVWGTCDADMQNDPGDIPRLMALLGPDVDMVNGWRQKRKDTLWYKVQSKIANKIRNSISGETIKDTGCALKVYKRECLQGLTLYKGMHRFFPTLVKMRGFKVIEVPVSHSQRLTGVSKYNMMNRALRAFVDLLAVRWMKQRVLRYQARERDVQGQSVGPVISGV